MENPTTISKRTDIPALIGEDRKKMKAWIAHRLTMHGYSKADARRMAYGIPSCVLLAIATLKPEDLPIDLLHDENLERYKVEPFQATLEHTDPGIDEQLIKIKMLYGELSKSDADLNNRINELYDHNDRRIEEIESLQATASSHDDKIAEVIFGVNRLTAGQKKLEERLTKVEQLLSAIKGHPAVHIVSITDMMDHIRSLEDAGNKRLADIDEIHARLEALERPSIATRIKSYFTKSK